jgi:hypothetical protein
LLNGAVKQSSAAALQGFFDSSARMNRQVFDEDHAICKRIAKDAADNPRFGILSSDEEKIAHFRACLLAAASN